MLRSITFDAKIRKKNATIQYVQYYLISYWCTVIHNLILWLPICIWSIFLQINFPVKFCSPVESFSRCVNVVFDTLQVIRPVMLIIFSISLLIAFDCTCMMPQHVQSILVVAHGQNMLRVPVNVLEAVHQPLLLLL